jgi:transcriptional regulator with XRE-family HTH domain
VDQLNAEFKRLLRLSGWSQAEAARHLHLNRSTVSLYLSGQTRPSVPVLQLFKLMLGDLTPLPGQPPEASARVSPPLVPLDEEETALLRRLRALGGPRRRTVLAAFQSILAEMSPPAEG